MDDAFGVMPGDGDETVRRVIQPINAARGWMKLLAVMMFISGGLAALTIIGLLVAWLPLWMGYLLWKSASSAEDATMSGSEAEAIDSLSRLKIMFTVQGVLMAIYLGLTALFIILIIVMAVLNSSN
ncbi:MAG: DUF5362 family protein [Actinomycetota bacterium]|nr:DUF5362 family protein [Actinomycetota bacterium]